MRVISRFGDYLAVGIVGGFALLLALTWGADPKPAELIESPVFAVSVKGITAIDEANATHTNLKAGTKCMLLSEEGPDGAIIEVDGRQWRVHRSCVKVLTTDR